MTCISDNHPKNSGVPYGSHQPKQTRMGLHYDSHPSSHPSQSRHRSNHSPIRSVRLKKFSGLGILHPYYDQQIKHLHTCLEQSVTKSITKNLIHTNTKQLQLELGFNTQGYWFTPNTKAYLTPSWTCDLFTFCDEHSIQLINTCPTLSLRTTNDCFLMQIFQCHYQGNDLRLLHQCCEFLKSIIR